MSEAMAFNYRLRVCGAAVVIGCGGTNLIQGKSYPCPNRCRLALHRAFRYSPRSSSPDIVSPSTFPVKVKERALPPCDACDFLEGRRPGVGLGTRENINHCRPRTDGSLQLLCVVYFYEPVSICSPSAAISCIIPSHDDLH